MRRQRNFWLSVTHPLLLIVAALLVLLLATVGLFPKIITGDYCHLTIASIHVDERGQTELRWNGTKSCNTTNSLWFYVNGVRQNGGPGGWSSGFPAWPASCASTVLFPLDRQHKNLDRATLLSRLKVVEGETYMVRPGQPLTLYQFTEVDGTIYEGRIEVP